MKATTKAYAMSSGMVTSFVMFATFFALTGMESMIVSTPYSMAFLFIGISLPFLISSLVIGSTARHPSSWLTRYQDKTITRLMEGKAEPDYAACVDISTKNALRR